MLSEPPRFLFDVMLARLCRYVRAAGYDGELAGQDEADAELLARAKATGRWFVTLDRRITQHKAAAGRAIVLAHGDVDSQATELARAVAIDWLYRPFSRCLMDNTLLETAPPGTEAALPPHVRATGPALRRCPRCKRVYWAGSHYRRMRARLQRWAAQNAAGASEAGGAAPHSGSRG